MVSAFTPQRLEPALVAYTSEIDSSEVFFATVDETTRNRPADHLVIVQRDAAARWPDAGDYFVTIVGYLQPVGISESPGWTVFTLPDDGPYVYLDTYTSREDALDALCLYAGEEAPAGQRPDQPTL